MCRQAEQTRYERGEQDLPPIMNRIPLVSTKKSKSSKGKRDKGTDKGTGKGSGSSSKQ